MVKAYLVNGFSSDLSLNIVEQSTINRENLTVIPTALKYINIDINETTKVFKNNVGANISVQLLGVFKDESEPIKLYDEGSDLYNTIYSTFVNEIHPQKQDSDWNMLILTSDEYLDPIIDYNLCKLNKLDLLHFSTINLIDSCMIYQTFKIIQEFIKTIKLSRTMSKTESFLIGYYLDVLNTLKKPNDFLINNKEIEYMQEFYDKWSLGAINDNLISSLSSTIEVFDFTFQYENNKKNKLSSMLFSILTIILGYTSLADFFSDNNVIKIILNILFGFFAVFMIVRVIFQSSKYIREKVEYYKKIKK